MSRMQDLVTGRLPDWTPTPRRASALYLLALIFVVFGLWIPDLFFSAATFKVVLSNQVVIGMLALALLVPFTAGAFDLSVGAVLAFSVVIMSWLGQNTSLNSGVSALIAVVSCSVAGLVSGIVTVKFRVNSFIATLGMSQLLAAATLKISGNREIVGVFSNSFLRIGEGNWFGIPKVVYYLAVLAAIIWYVLEWTPLGRHLFATGSNQEAARLAGVRTDRLVIGSLVASAFIAGVAGVLYAAQVGTFSNSIGPPFLFPAFAALFFGSTQFKSRPNVWGTMLAVYVLAFGVKGLQLTSTSSEYWVTPAFNGAALLIAVSMAGRLGLLSVRKRSARLDQAVRHQDGSSNTQPPASGVTGGAGSASDGVRNTGSQLTTMR